MVKILQIGNYPRLICGWPIQTKPVTEELRLARVRRRIASPGTAADGKVQDAVCRIKSQ
jgi:hypothetical protein